MHAPAPLIPQSVSSHRLVPAVEGLVSGGAEHIVHAADVLEDLRSDAGAVFDEALTRGSAAWDVLRGERVGPPTAARRWPWAVGAAFAGAAAGVGVAFLLRRLRTQDAPDAVDPERVEAVVDRAPAGTKKG